MASNTYVALKATTVTGSPVGSVTLSSIPQGYTDLVLVINGSASGASDVGLQFNSDTASNYSRTWLSGNGSSAFSGRASSVAFAKISAYGNMNTSFNFNAIVNIQNYSNTTTYKTILSRSNNASLGTDAIVNLWRSTSAITSIYVYSPDSQTFSVGTTFTLYGIAAASVGAKATGGTIYQDASYFYHVFSGNGTFTPSQSISADVLVIAGGGGGGNDQGGGGGAGGILAYTSQSLTATGYTCTIGAGGSSATNGVDSSFGALTAAVGGGRGGYYNGVSGATGGSGGGGGGGTSAGSGGSATSGQGYAGGNGFAGNPNWGGGGGGGSGVVGTNAASGVPGAGGNGTTTYTSWLSATGFGQNVSGTYYIAGGGAGGGTQATYNPTGYGGGGLGGSNITGALFSGTAALANTGSGGGGAGATGGASGGAGGSGLVIVRYAK